MSQIGMICGMKRGTKKQPTDLPEDALSVSQVTARVKDHLESRFNDVWVTGEVTNLVTAGSGHIYLGLKDEAALLRSVIWRGTRGSAAALHWEWGVCGVETNVLTWHACEQHR